MSQKTAQFAGTYITQGNHVLLVQEAHQEARGLWSLPLGHVEKNENAAEAAIRETKEETGYKTKTQFPETSLFIQGSEFKSTKQYRASLIHLTIYPAIVKGGTLTIGDVLDVRWFPIKQLNKLRFRGDWVKKIIRTFESRVGLEINKSKIAKNGIFTEKKIKKGEPVFILQGELCSLEEIIKKVQEGKEDAADPLYLGNEEYLDLEEFSRTFNHSCNPNTFVRGERELIALRDISRGEEITFDYSTTMDDNEEKIVRAGLSLWTCPCNCQSQSCRGTIDQFVTLPEKFRNYYITHKFLPDFMLRKFG